MDRRQFATLAATLGGGLVLVPPRILEALTRQDASALSATYAESVEVSGMTADGALELSVRLARFPSRDAGTLWVTVGIGDRIYNAALDNVGLANFTARTHVEDVDAQFEVKAGADNAAVLSRRHDNGLEGLARVTVGAHLTADPPTGPGPQLLTIDTRFASDHTPVYVLPARLEVMGHITATIRTPEGVHTIDGPGKWHEQTGNRPRFAAPFTYLTALGDQHGLLAVKRQPTAFGFAWIGRDIMKVRRVEIDAPTSAMSSQRDSPAAHRKFRVEIENGRVIEGEATTLRTISLPIEGQRRPGATVAVTSTIGPMVGHINDWTG